MPLGIRCIFGLPALRELFPGEQESQSGGLRAVAVWAIRLDSVQGIQLAEDKPAAVAGFTGCLGRTHGGRTMRMSGTSITRIFRPSCSTCRDW